MKNKNEKFMDEMEQLEIQFRIHKNLEIAISELTKLVDEYLEEYNCTRNVGSFTDKTGRKYEYSSIVIMIKINKKEEPKWGELVDLDFMVDEYINIIVLTRFIVYDVKIKT